MRDYLIDDRPIYRGYLVVALSSMSGPPTWQIAVIGGDTIEVGLKSYDAAIAIIDDWHNAR